MIWCQDLNTFVFWKMNARLHEKEILTKVFLKNFNRIFLALELADKVNAVMKNLSDNITIV